MLLKNEGNAVAGYVAAVVFVDGYSEVWEAREVPRDSMWNEDCSRGCDEIRRSGDQLSQENSLAVAVAQQSFRPYSHPPESQED